MIRTTRQLNLTKESAAEFESAIEKARLNGAGEGVHPIIFAAQIDGLESQLESLRREISEYETLCAGNVDSINLTSLQDLPIGLIKARIASGLTQQQLAERLGVKAQQIQRWEHEDYESVGFQKLVDIATALDLNISEHIQLPAKPKDAITALKQIGIERAFLFARLASNDDKYEKHLWTDQDLICSAAPRLNKIFGIGLSANGLLVNGGVQSAGASGRFKVPSNADASKVDAYSTYAHYLAKTVAFAFGEKPAETVPRDWQALRQFLCGDQPPTFEVLLRGAWQRGIAVLPLADPIRFHGVCWRFAGRNVVVLKQSTQFSSRWAFNLIHEIYHAGETPELETLECIELDATDKSRRESEDEVQANQIAGDILLEGRADHLYKAVLRSAANRVPYLKNAVKKIAERDNVDVAHLANYVAFRVKSELFVTWWGAAANLQPEGESPLEIARKVMTENLELWRLESDDRDLLLQALADPHLPNEAAVAH